jgi:hypothetical protein
MGDIGPTRGNKKLIIKKRNWEELFTIKVKMGTTIII